MIPRGLVAARWARSVAPRTLPASARGIADAVAVEKPSTTEPQSSTGDPGRAGEAASSLLREHRTGGSASSASRRLEGLWALARRGQLRTATDEALQTAGITKEAFRAATAGKPDPVAMSELRRFVDAACSQEEAGDDSDSGARHVGGPSDPREPRLPSPLPLAAPALRPLEEVAGVAGRSDEMGARESPVPWDDDWSAAAEPWDPPPPAGSASRHPATPTSPVSWSAAAAPPPSSPQSWAEKTLSRAGVHLPSYRTGQYRIVCPSCGGGSSQEASLAVSVGDDSVAWTCHRATCGLTGGRKRRREAAEVGDAGAALRAASGYDASGSGRSAREAGLEGGSGGAAWQGGHGAPRGLAAAADADPAAAQLGPWGRGGPSPARGAASSKRRAELPPVRPVVDLEPLTPEMLAFFAARGISADVLARSRVASERRRAPWDRSQPGTGRAQGTGPGSYSPVADPSAAPRRPSAPAPVIAFGYYRGDELVNVKYRTLDKRFWQSKGGEKVLYGLDTVEGARGAAGAAAGGDASSGRPSAPLVIAEGEIDKLSLDAAGVPNALSVPDGAPARAREGPTPPEEEDLKFSYLWACRDVLDASPRIVLATDADGPGDALAEELARRLGRERCYRVRWPQTRDDHLRVRARVREGRRAQRRAVREALDKTRGAELAAGAEGVDGAPVAGAEGVDGAPAASAQRVDGARFSDTEVGDLGDLGGGQVSNPGHRHPERDRPAGLGLEAEDLAEILAPAALPSPPSGVADPGAALAGAEDGLALAADPWRSWLESTLVSLEDESDLDLDGEGGTEGAGGDPGRWRRKDANDVLVRDGPEVLRALIDSAEEFPIQGLLRFNAFYDDVLRFYHLESGTGRAFSTGWPAVDEYYRVVPGELTVVTGVPNSGKSEWLDALLCNLSALHGWSFAMCSLEKTAPDHARQLVEKASGKPFFDLPYARGVPRITEDELRGALDWVDDRFHLVRRDADAIPSVDWVLGVARAAVYRHGVRGLVIDPYNELDHQRAGNVSETEYVSRMLGAVKRFAAGAGCHVWFVAHPRQLPGWKGEAPGLYDISGSAHFINKADNGIVVHRDRNPDSPNPAAVGVLVRKVRSKIAGKIGEAVLEYDRVNGRYLDPSVSDDQVPPTSRRRL